MEPTGYYSTEFNYCLSAKPPLLISDRSHPGTKHPRHGDGDIGPPYGANYNQALYYRYPHHNILQPEQASISRAASPVVRHHQRPVGLSPGMSLLKENRQVFQLPRCVREIDFHQSDFHQSDFHQSDFAEESLDGHVTVAKRNERERNRVKLINKTFQVRVHYCKPLFIIFIFRELREN